MIIPSAILVVENESLFATALALFLADEGYVVRTAHNGALALALHTQRPADLVLSDVMMPGGDGIALVESLRARGDRTPVILMSGYAWGTNIPSDVPLVPKPFDLDDLFSLVRRTLP